jgi:hypothetical protein
MRIKARNFFFTVFLSLLITACVFADNKGTDFWIAFPQNYTGSTTCMPALYIYSDVVAYGTITAYAMMFPVNFSVPAGGYITAPLNYVNAAYGNDAITKTGIHIEASSPVTVYGLSKDDVTTDGFLALPVSSLGTQYIVLAYSGRFFDLLWMNSQMAVTASEDNTIVHIDCPVNPGTRPAPYDVTLNRGDVYQLVDAASPAKDLTGTKITANKPVAVFGGHRCAKIPETYMAADYIVEQLPPVNSWGMECYSMPLMGRSGGDTFRVVAAEDGTSLTVNATPIALLNSGQGVEFISAIPNHIKADRPILAAQFANGMEYDGNPGDPFMMLLTHPEQFVTASTIVSPAGYTGNYVNIVCASADAGSIVFDGINIPAGLFSAIDASGFSGTRRAVASGKHVITSPNKFGIWVYAFKDYESYGAGGIFFTPTISPTITETHTITPTFSITETHADTVTFTPSRTRTMTFTPSFTRTATSTWTVSPTFTHTMTGTDTRTMTPTRTPSFSVTPTITMTPTNNPSQSSTETSSITPAYSFTSTMTRTGTPAYTSTDTATFTPTIAYSLTLTATAVFSATRTAVLSPSDTPIATCTGTRTFTYTATPSNTFTKTFTYTPSVSPETTLTLTFTHTSFATSTPALTPTSTITCTATPPTGPLVLLLKGNYPDPVLTHTEIIFWLSKDAEIAVKIFNVSGEVVFESTGQKGKYGNNIFSWDMTNKRYRQTGSGVYLYKVRAKNGLETSEAISKMAIVK